MPGRRQQAYERLPHRLRGARWDVLMRVARSLVDAGRMAKDAWDRLSHPEQQELMRLVRRSGGRLRALDQPERAEMRRLVMKALGFPR